MKDFASIAKPLHCLTERTAKFEWTSECQLAFDRLRQGLVTAPVLAFPDFTRPFILDTDASDTGIGAVLSQSMEDGCEHVISYASRVLTKPERHYCVTRRELLAVLLSSISDHTYWEENYCFIQTMVLWHGCGISRNLRVSWPIG